MIHKSPRKNDIFAIFILVDALKFEFHEYSIEKVPLS